MQFNWQPLGQIHSMVCCTQFVTLSLELRENSSAVCKAQLLLIVPPHSTDPEMQVAVAANTEIGELVNGGSSVAFRPWGITFTLAISPLFRALVHDDPHLSTLCCLQTPQL